MDEISKRIDALLSRARESLVLETSEMTKRRIDDHLRDLAAELALQWITGERRFENQGQQLEHWLGHLYENLFVDEQPNPARIYARFGVPLTRAQYVSRLLFARRKNQWRDAAVREVKAALESVEVKAKDALIEKAGKTQSFDLSLTRGGFEQLIVFYDLVAGSSREQNRPEPPKRIAGSGSLAWFSINAATTLRLLEYINTEHRE